MTIQKRISSKKTATGYFIGISVKEGCHVTALLKVIEHYFNMCEVEIQKQSVLDQDLYENDEV